MILRKSTSESDVNVFADFMRFEKTSEARSEYGVVRAVTWRIDQDTEMDYGEERISGCSFLQVVGDSQKRVDDITYAVDEYFRPWTLSDVLEGVEAARGTENRAAAIVRAGVAAPNIFDQRFYECFSSAISDAHERIREAGIWACSYSHWLEFRPLLEGLESDDPVEQLRADAGIILDVAYREAEP